MLVEVDRDTPDDRPLLSALIAGRDDWVHPLFRRVIFNLGGPDIPETAIYMHWRMALRHHFTVKAF